MSQNRKFSPHAAHVYSQDPQAQTVGRVTGTVPTLETYGHPKVEGATQLQYEQLSFLRHLGLGKAGVTKLQNLKNIILTCWPKTVVTEWNDDMWGSLCDYDFVSWAGCAASGKTHGAAVFAVAWWLCNPQESAVIMTSTTKGMIRRRMWPPIQMLYSTWALGSKPGNMVDSRTVWQATRGDDKHAIFAQAVREGNTEVAVANIQGFHPKRLLVIIDEGTDTPKAIYDAVDNLISGPEEFKMLVIGNPNSKFDPHGQFSEPKKGWKSVSIDDDRWETKPKFNQPGVLVRFDAAKSPNLRYDGVKYPFLVTRQQYENAISGLGENKPSFWKFWRGFWAPSGMVQTVMDEALVTQHDVSGGFEWKQVVATLAACDPAFGGGDRPMFRTGILGITTENKVALLADTKQEIPLDATKKDEPVHYQIAKFCIETCKSRQIPPHYFGIDSTGEGGGTADIISYEWSPAIHRCEFGTAPTDMPVSTEDVRKAKDVYDRKVSELWFRCANLVESDQLRGFCEETIIEFCTRTWDFKGKKMAVQTKKEMKEIYGRSPDLADSIAVLVDTAFVNGLFESSDGSATHKMEQEGSAPGAYDIYDDEVGDEMEEVDYVAD